MTIYFYTKSQKYYEFSNFSAHGIMMQEKWWPTVEHYFQAQKFEDENYVEQIRRAENPHKAKRLGRTRKLPIRKNWDHIRVRIMEEAVLAKFKTHSKIAQMLINTGEQTLVENAPHDYFWGCGTQGTGQNMLGKILMKVRTELKKAGSQ